MKSAFSSRLHAAGFAFLLLAFLSLPLLLSGLGFRSRQNVYLAMVRNAGPFPWIHEQIFMETEPVDIAFVGSSRMMADVNTPFVKQALEKKLGRKANVITLSWNSPGYDALYTIAQDLVRRRRVHMIVIYDDYGTRPHPFAACWLRVGDSSQTFDDMPWSIQLSVYANAVLGAPRQLLGLVRHENLDPHWDTRPYFYQKNGVSFKVQLGSLRERVGFGDNPAQFVSYRPKSRVTPEDVMHYSPATRPVFTAVDSDTSSYQIYFARKLAALCKNKGTHLVGLYLPDIDQRDSTSIPWHEPMLEFAKSGLINLIGIPGATLFAGIPRDDVSKFFYNKWHMNQNGQDYFTPLITPPLLELYEKSTYN